MMLMRKSFSIFPHPDLLSAILWRQTTGLSASSFTHPQGSTRAHLGLKSVLSFVSTCSLLLYLHAPAPLILAKNLCPAFEGNLDMNTVPDRVCTVAIANSIGDSHCRSWRRSCPELARRYSEEVHSSVHRSLSDMAAHAAMSSCIHNTPLCTPIP